MPTTMPTWITHHWRRDIKDLRSLAQRVTSGPTAAPALTARAAATAMSGIVGLVANRWSVDTMQRACADLVRHTPAWSSSFAKLPNEGAGAAISEPVFLIAMAARGLLPIVTADNLRAALAFWASESDTSVWTDVAVAS